jgi:hypothetical protein
MSLVWSATEFQRLLEARDLAAYRAVSAIAQVVDFFEAQDYENALALLKKVRAEFQEADQRVHQFRKSSKGETTRHGNRTAV